MCSKQDQTAHSPNAVGWCRWWMPAHQGDIDYFKFFRRQTPLVWDTGMGYGTGRQCPQFCGKVEPREKQQIRFNRLMLLGFGPRGQVWENTMSLSHGDNAAVH